MIVLALMSMFSLFLLNVSGLPVIFMTGAMASPRGVPVPVVKVKIWLPWRRPIVDSTMAVHPM